jgi:transposase
MKHHLGLSFKKTKTLLPTENLEQLHDKRRCFESYRKSIDIHSVISVDETSFYQKFSPKYAWSPKKNYIHVPQQMLQSSRSTLISAISAIKVIYQMLIPASCNTSTFEEFIRDLPVDENHKYILLDNVSFHRSKTVLKAIENKGLTPLFTAPYSPDYNPIEMYFGWLKNRMRRGKPFGVPSSKMCTGWFNHSWVHSYA